MTPPPYLPQMDWITNALVCAGALVVLLIGILIECRITSKAGITDKSNEQTEAGKPP